MGTGTRGAGRRDGEGGYVSGNGDDCLQVQVYVEQVGQRTPAWRELWRRLLSPAPCQIDDLDLDCEPDDAAEGLTDLTSG